MISYLFWKNVYHYSWLYGIAWIWYFCFYKEFRSIVKLDWGCKKVQRQDEYRVWVTKFNKEWEEIRDLLKSTMAFINSLNGEIKTTKQIKNKPCNSKTLK